MTDIRKYWNNWILEWEKISYEGRRPQGIVERLASRFRSVKQRMDNALTILSPLVRGRTILDLGCGSGIFDRFLIHAGAVDVWGIDFSNSAIERAKERAAELKINDKCHYECAAITEANFPRTDITVALGLLDYLAPNEVIAVFRKTESQYYLMSFLQRKLSISMVLHSFYTRYRKVPVVKRYRASQLREFLAKAGKTGYSIDDSKSFVLKLPPIADGTQLA